jgi:hypothetical protein
MKKTVFILLLIAGSVISNAQCKFYTNNGATLITETKCEEYKDITIVVPVPSDISKYDAFTVYLDIPSFSFTPYYTFNENKINDLLIGKKEVSLLLISADGKESDFVYEELGGDREFKDKILCEEPRIKGLDSITIKAVTNGRRILSYYSETYWSDYSEMYITRDVPQWDDAVELSEGVLVIKQSSDLAIVSDYENILSLKLPISPKCYYFTRSPYDYSDKHEGIIIVDDSSLEEDFRSAFVYFNEKNYSLDYIKNDLLKYFTSNERPDIDWWDYLGMGTGTIHYYYHKKKSPITSKEWETVKINNKDFFHFVYRQQRHNTKIDKYNFYPEAKIHLYIYYQSPYIVVAAGKLFIMCDEDVIKMDEETVLKAEDIIKRTVGSIDIKE